jgi:hypothetical protein
MTAKAAKRTSTVPPREASAIVDEITAMLGKYVPPLELRTDAKGGYHAWSNKPVVIDGRRKREVYFAGVIPQKAYVGFYYMPVYTNPERKAMFEPEMLALLKGKSCFHLRSLEPSLRKQIRAALQSGFRLYKQRGWV